ncbi:iron complex outermembrane recepter protein [Algoriphagus locisalis]|uniref:Iron complex outermembrane recepter protein n=1 Tax=Algoriphagus locisalis TaxID=305507 RepID=A0A1I6XFE1_9BACT|nr:TonB-dependent receptor [Algoriphagus locisalis]SFT36876.1 iron complex outermembrane recepter protein [Algoriphagus locisalis]
MKKVIALTLTLLIWQHVVKAQATLTGIVLDQDKLPLIGATVNIKGTDKFTITGEQGEFSLALPARFPVTLKVNFVGFKEFLLPLKAEPVNPLSITLENDAELAEVLITARRRTEAVQKVPIPIAVVGGPRIADAGAFNVNRIKELIPTVQLYSSNPRNTTLNIRGLGSTFGLTNDGIDPGVGFYVDGVYYARPAATTLDFIDVEQIEVLRGPQGTLFGKNTTAGAFNITTKIPEFTPGGKVELSYGNLGFIQAKASITGPLSKSLAARLSFSGTQRNGTIEHVNSGKFINDINNLGFRGQLLYNPSSKLEIILAGDASFQRPDGYAQVPAGVVTTQRPEFRQFDTIIKDLNYSLPSTNAFDRLIDHDTPWRSKNDLGGISVNIDYELGNGTLTSTTAWRYWIWGPSNDRDFTGLPVQTLSQAPSRHDQFSQEIRYAGDFSDKLSGVAGIYFLGQNLETDPFHSEETGASAWRFLQNNQDPLWQTPGLLDGYGIRTTSQLKSSSAAVFGQLDWSITEKLSLLPGIRFNYDKKDVDYNRTTYGGLQTDDPELLALKARVYSPQSFQVDVSEQNFSGQVTLAYRPTEKLSTYATASTSYKPVGVNLGGLPTENGEPLTELATVKPEYVTHFELGLKASPTKGTNFNVSAYHTSIEDFQTLVQTPEPGVNRGYLSNAEEVRVMGVEIDGNVRLSRNFTITGSVAYTDGIYESFTNAPVPLEEVGGEITFKEISGERLPGISKWAGSLGAEFTIPTKFFDQQSNFFLGADSYFRSEFSSSPSPSEFLNVPGYGLVNARTGFRNSNGLSAFIWTRNLLNKDYYEQLLPASGSTGLYAAVLGDPVTYGITLRYQF